MRHIPIIAAVLAAAVLAPIAASADRMWVGFHDDPILRYDANRQSAMETATATNNASIIRSLVTWADIAPTRPADAANAFDPAYRFDDLDEFVRNAQQNNVEVLLTLWGTPKWANGNKERNHLPTSMTDFQNFAKAVASRYSGRTAGYPFVRFFGIWNESNLGLFLSPQFNSKGQIVGPAAYAKLAAAGYAGVKAGNARALVAVGETSSSGRDKKKPGVSDAVAPGTFARLVAKANKKLRFDAWAHHPYPVPVNQKPTQKVKWPNVAFTSLPQFERSLDGWFGRKNIPIWISEYGHETKPGEPKGVTEGQQAAYIPQAIAIAKKDPRVQMFIWFVLQDSSGSLWQSGVYRKDGSAKPGQPRWAAAAKPLSPANGKVRVKGGTKNPLITVYLRSFCVNNPIGVKVGVAARTTLGGKLVAYSQSESALAIDCTAATRVTGLKVIKGKTYIVTIDANTKNGDTATRQITIVGA
ncbi:cellulase family glycosylhydrolase [Gaiella sp.]|uniref:cellulase family glycosylhydrolase n=1 Tax=Gaiella sp. TaxID=2663207 RepID=UPI0032664A26